MITVLGAMGHSADRQASVAVPDLLSDAQVAGIGASASPPNVPARSADRTIADASQPLMGPAAHAPKPTPGRHRDRPSGVESCPSPSYPRWPC